MSIIRLQVSVDGSNTSYINMSTPRTGYSHKLLIPLRIIQLILGLGVLGISAYHIHMHRATYITYDVGYHTCFLE